MNTSPYIPQSVKDYIEDQKINQSVEILIEDLCSETHEASNREEAATYNQALLMAAQVRADYVDMLWCIWDETFGAAYKNAKERNLQEEFHPECSSPAYVWSNGFVFSYLVPSSRRNDSNISYELMVKQEEKLSGIVLYAKKWDKKRKEYIDFDNCDVDGWEYVNDHLEFETNIVRFDEFFSDPEKHITIWREAAKAMVEFVAMAP